MRRFAVLFLTVCLLCSILPVNVLAEELLPDEYLLSTELETEELFLETEEVFLSEPEINAATEAAEIIEEIKGQLELEEVILTEAGMEQEAASVREYFLPSMTAASPGELDHDALLNGYVYNLFYDGYGEQEAFEASTISERLTGVDAKTYQILKKCISEVASGDRSSTVFRIPVTEFTGGKTSWTGEELGIIASTKDAHVSKQIEKAVVDMLFCDLEVILSALLADCPYELYWFAKTEGFSVGMDSGYMLYDKQGSFHIEIDTSANILYSFSVSSVYSAGNYTMNSQAVQKARQAASTAKMIVDQYSSLSDAQKLKAYKEEICSLVGYNYDAKGKTSAGYNGNAWHLVWVFDGDPSTNVVCEGYAKAFQYLCDLSSFSKEDVRVYSVSGWIDGGDHMWNIAHMQDGRNYLIDVTNCDSGIAGQGDGLFLVGGKSQNAKTYIVTCGASVLTYQYDNDMSLIYTEEELTLSDSAYDPSSAPPADPTAIEEYIKRCYKVILNRDADSDGLAYWRDALVRGDAAGADIVSLFCNSAEFQNKNLPNREVVTILYNAMLSRSPDTDGLNYWEDLFDKGVSCNLIISGFVGSAEFVGICAEYGIKPGTVELEPRDLNPMVTAFVSRCYACALNRKEDAAGLNGWASALLDGIMTAQEVSFQFVFSKECEDLNLSNAEFISRMYLLYMGRNADTGGQGYWQGMMKSGTSRETVVRSFAGSEEFKGIVQSYGLG